MLKVGQIWREVDPRFERFVRIEAINGAEVQWARVRTVKKYGNVWSATPGARVSNAQAQRFNGKRGGYELVEDVP